MDVDDDDDDDDVGLDVKDDIDVVDDGGVDEIDEREIETLTTRMRRYSDVNYDGEKYRSGRKWPCDGGKRSVAGLSVKGSERSNCARHSARHSARQMH